jgi:hypothetical protein
LDTAMDDIANQDPVHVAPFISDQEGTIRI